MRRTIWSIPAVFLVGALAWAQSPPSLVPSPPVPSDSNSLDRGVNRDEFNLRPTVPTIQVYPDSGQAIRKDPNGNSFFTVPVPSGAVPIASGFHNPLIAAPPAGAMKAKQIHRTVTVTEFQPMSEQEVAAMKQYQEVVSVLRSDKPDSEKEAARKSLRDLLSTGFDQDLASRESELQDLESRVQKLRSQLDKRKAAKQEIIDLRLKTIQNEADGLEYPSTGTPIGPTIPNTDPVPNSVPSLKAR